MKEHLMKMELYKVCREIEMHGKPYTISRERKDDRGESTGEYEQLVIVNGLFHTSKSYASGIVDDGGRTHTKGQPMILLRYEDSLGISGGDVVTSDGNKNRYKVIEKNNIQEYNSVVDISLEVILDGTN